MAVYTHISDEQVAQFLEHYDVGKLQSLKGIAEGVENSNFLLTTTKSQFILTLYEKRVNTRDLPFFISLMEHLAQKDISCPRPIAKNNGEALGKLAGRPAAMISFLNGYSVRVPSIPQCGQCGVALAQLHLAGVDFKTVRKNALSQKHWQPLYERSKSRAKEVDVELGSLLDDELPYLDRLWPENLPAGIIHADLFPDNVFFLEDQLSGIIDFYFAANDLLAYDLAICINAWCFDEDGNFEPKKSEALLEGYQSVRPLKKEEYDALPILCRGSATRFLLTRLYDWLNVPKNALVTPHDPRDYITRLKFHRQVKDPSIYGSAH